jgi:DNA-binding transcriptional regulator YiaG
LATIASLGYIADGWAAQFHRDLSHELRTVKGIKPGSRRGDAVLAAAVKTFEALVTKIIADLGDERSGLFKAVSQVVPPDALRDAVSATGAIVRAGNDQVNRRLTVRGILALGAFAGALALGGAEGAGQVVADRFMPNEPSHTHVLDDLTLSCERLAQEVRSARADVTTGSLHATFGEELAARRRRAGLSQGELADALNVTRSIISAWENDRRRPRRPHAEELDQFLNANGQLVDLLEDKRATDRRDPPDPG